MSRSAAAQPASRAALEIRLLPVEGARLVRITEYLAVSRDGNDGTASRRARLLPHPSDSRPATLAPAPEDEWRDATWEDAEWR
jgi:hypothetical protein